VRRPGLQSPGKAFGMIERDDCVPHGISDFGCGDSSFRYDNGTARALTGLDLRPRSS